MTIGKIEQTTGDRIKKIRGALTQKEFADLLGIGNSTLSRYERNEQSPNMDTVLKLNMIYKIQPIWLLTGVGQDVAGERLLQDEMDLLRNYRQCTDEGKNALRNMAALTVRNAPIVI